MNLDSAGYANQSFDGLWVATGVSTISESPAGYPSPDPTVPGGRQPPGLEPFSNTTGPRAVPEVVSGLRGIATPCNPAPGPPPPLEAKRMTAGDKAGLTSLVLDLLIVAIKESVFDRV